MADTLAPTLSILSPNPSPLPGPSLLHELICQPPDLAAIAIDFLENGSNRQLSYAELYRASTSLAQQISRWLEGVKSGPAVIPVFISQSPELYVALIAVLKAGKAFCPLSLDTPDERLEFMLKDLSATVVLTTSGRQPDAFRRTNVEPISVNLNALLSEDEVRPNPVSGLPASTAYVLYTSGSTGLPKAVSVSHRAVTQSLLAHDRHIPSFQRFLQFAAPTFDVSIFEIFFPLFRGKTLVGCSREHMLNNLPAVISDLRVDAAELTPTVAGNLLQGRKSVPSLKLLLTIGEMLTRHVVDEYGGNSTTRGILWGMYGPTEAAIHCTLQPDFQSTAPVNGIGFPLDTVSAFVMAPTDASQRSTELVILPLGETGELVVGGHQVADGYLNRPDLTSAAFVRHPKYGLLYRTGDKARMLPDGTIECLGRMVSGQVKIRGQRVELGEVEEALLKVDGCHTAVVLAISDTLVAFCSGSAQDFSRQLVLKKCKRWLPSYMVPADVVFLQKMPQLPSGKIDKKALEGKYVQERTTIDLPTPPPDSLVHRRVQDVLGQDVSFGTPLSAFGLDSLRSIQIASMLRKEGFEVGAFDILSASNLENLIALCDSKKTGPTKDQPAVQDAFAAGTFTHSLLQNSRDDVSKVIPCTPLQEAMLAETIIRSDAYCNRVEVELSGQHTYQEIRYHILRLAENIEILRSGFIPIDSPSSHSFGQVIWKELDRDQVTEVSSFTRNYSLGSADSMLRPLSVQVNMKFDKPRLLLQIHHALYDGWSLDLLLGDLGSFLNGAVPTPRPQFSSVADYHARFRSQISKESTAYWSDVLKGYYPASIPNFNGRIVGDAGLQSMTRASAISLSSLSDSAKEKQLNPQVLFQAAIAYMLGHYTGSSDVLLGSVTSGRTIPVTGIEDIVGPCIASLPLRLDLSAFQTVVEMLRSIHQSNRDMLQHCTLPLRDIVKLCGLQPGSQLFDILFVWQETLHALDEDCPVKLVDQADFLEYKLTLEFEPRQNRIVSKATYDAAFFPETQVQRLLDQVDELVTYFIQAMDSQMSDVGKCFSLNSLSIANPSPTSIPQDHGPAYTVERWASEAPEKKALIFGSRHNGVLKITKELTYAELNMRANQLAHHLLELGVGNDELVCVLLDKSPRLYVSILAVLKVGCGYLPIVPDSPPERTKTILEDAAVRICLSETASSSSIRNVTSYNILDLDTLDLSGCPTNNPDIAYTPSNLAYAVFTSGSTGTPKGVLVTQDNLMNNLAYLHSIYPTSYESRLLQVCSQAFDVSVFEIFFAWYAGMGLCAATKDDMFRDLEDSISVLGVTHLSMTPTVAALVNPENVPKVEFLVTSGEGITEHVRRQWAGKGLWQGYGPSETTNICTVQPRCTLEHLINNIGPPFDNTSAFVMDPDSDVILPQGGIGELCFGGAQVFRGYLNRPELNAQKIINHPEYGRIYRSGDMGMLLTDNCILFARRADEQVKIRGQRVELGEITSNILDNSGVKDCATLLFRSSAGQERLVAFWVPSGASGKNGLFKPLSTADLTTSIIDIFESLMSRLPAYMVPTHIIPISAVPYTTQTKIDKRLLLSTYESLSTEYLQSAAYATSEDSGPGALTEHERSIAQILAETTNVSLDDVSRTTSFFSLGLDSISAIQFSRMLRYAGVADVPVSAILKNPTVSRLAACCVRPCGSEAPKVDRLQQVKDLLPPDIHQQVTAIYNKRDLQVEKVLPCTPLQEAMLSASASTSSYCNTMAFTVSGDFNRLKQCWDEMVRRHGILRTAFVPTDDVDFAFVQVVLPHEQVSWCELELDQEPTEYVATHLAAALEASLPPVLLASRQPNGAKQIIFGCHHALYDGVAITALLDEVEKLYLGETLPPPVPYEGYLHYVFSGDTGAADDFWKNELANFEPTYFPRLSSQLDGSVSGASRHVQRLEVPLSDINRFWQDASLSLLSVVQATWAKILHFYTGEQDICFGNVVSGRTLPEQDLDRLIAPCFNTLPVRLNFDYRKSNADMMRSFHDTNIESLPYQLTPLRRIQTQCLKEGGRLFDTLMILQQPSTALNSSIWALIDDDGAMDLPVVCEIMQDETNDSLVLTLHYQNSLMSGNDAALVAETFDSTLQSLVRYPKSPARDAIGCPQDLLSISNPKFTVLEDAEDHLLHTHFETNAVSRPEHPALEFHVGEGIRTVWSFKQLNEKANKIAHALLDRGVQPEDIVPIHISKTPEFYASILGVLKAGAAFTPVQPDFPVARKQFMMRELEARVSLVTGYTNLDWCEDLELLDVNATAHYPAINPTIKGLKATSLAYCLYTSGSTGLPKAVCMDHRSPIQTVASSRELVPWTTDSRLLQYAAITFDMCYYDCFLAWSFGFTLCAAQQSAMLNDLPSVIRSLHIDLLDLTPSVAASLEKAKVPRVRWLYCIGEAMSTEVVKEWGDACVNSYGPTEAAFCTTIHPVKTTQNPNIIGKPFQTISFAVLPTSGDRVLPVFSVGELYIGGAQLARGYFKKPDLTDEKFVIRNGRRFYKSGDLVRMLGNGDFEFIGRVDDQVKIRGLRVELGEINAVVQGSDYRIGAVATQILTKTNDSKPQLVAFLEIRSVITEEQKSEIQRKAHEAAVEQLPAYMVPKFFISVDEIPKSAAGKVDKKALLQIFRDLGSGTSMPDTSAAEHKWTNTEAHIRGAFATISSTPIEEIGPKTTIYQLGLDSISAVQVAARLRKNGLEATVTDVLKYTTCVDLAARIERVGQTSDKALPNVPEFDFQAFDEQHRAEICNSHSIESKILLSIRPCTPLQSGMISQFLAKDGTVYLNYIKFRLEPGVDVRKLRGAWEKVMGTHQMLRTGFVEVKDRAHNFAMVTYDPASCALHWEHVTDAYVPSAVGWLGRLQREVLEHLHQPPWYIRTVEEGNNAFMELAIFHALYDAQSLKAITDDVAKTYAKLQVDEPEMLDPVISAILSSSDTEKNNSNEFWAKMEKTVSPSRFPNLAPLRYDPAPPAVVSRYCTVSLSQLEAARRQSNITLQAAGLAAWLSLLSAYIGEPSVTCGVVLSGRTEATGSAVFPCITTVPLAYNIADDKQKTLQDIMSFNAAVHMHQFSPLKEVQRLMGYPNEPLFDTIFTFQSIRTEENNRNVETLWTIVDEKATIEYPMSIELEPINDQLELRLTCLPHLVPVVQAEKILEQLDYLINSFVFDPPEADQNLSFDPKIYSITPPKEPTIPSDITLLHQFVEVTTSQTPDCIALEFATSIEDKQYTSDTWTYAEFNSRGNQVANLLISHGIRPGSLVGVCFDKCPEAYFAILGILKAGAAFVALDPGAPVARRAFIIEDSGANFVLSMREQSTGLTDHTEATILNMDDIDLSTMDSAEPVLERPVEPEDRSYCLYTSGTTGTPKGCEITHENAVQAMLSFRRLFNGHWVDDSRWLQFASFHFDVSVLEQYWSWFVGIRLVSAPRDLIFEDLARTIRVLEITHIDLTPSLARIVHPDDVPSLCRGVFITGGESLKQEILDVWGPKGVIYNGYGPTEATIGCTMYTRVPFNGKPSNIGPAFDNVGSFVLKPGTDIPVLRGGVGELCVSGKLVGKGYLNRPELTKERFAYLKRFDERVYRTGDLVRLFYDNTFEFLGRADDQVKLRGQRLEIGEINSVIKQSSPDISDVATLVLKHPKQQKEQLVSFVVTGSQDKCEPKIIMEARGEIEVAREACLEKLPGYMVPTHFIPLSAMPLSANNKGENKRLRQMYDDLSVADLQALSGLGSGKEEQWSANELKIREILQDMLQLAANDINRRSSIFELGLDSVSVISFARSLRQAGFPSAAASTIMKNPSIDRLAEALSTSSTSSDRSSILAAQQAIAAMQHRYRRSVAESLSVASEDIEALAPCTPLQQGMIARFLDRGDGLYFNSFVLQLSQNADINNLKAAWEGAFDAIQILRTVFADTEDGYVQAVLRKPSLPWLQSYTTSEGEIEVKMQDLKEEWWRTNQEVLKRPFELHLVTSSTRRVLVVHIFHALYDGISIELLFKSVWHSLRDNSVPEVGPSFLSLLPYGPLQRVKGAQKFWTAHLSASSLRAIPSTNSQRKGTISLERQIQDLKEYESVRRRLNVTPQAIAQACWATVLSNFFNSAVTLGLVVSGRNIDFEDAERVVGPTFNTIPYSHCLRSQEPWVSVIRKTHEFNVAAHPYQHTPLRDIMKWTRRSPDQPLFDTLFVYQVAEDSQGWTSNDIWELKSAAAAVDYPLALEVEQGPDETLKVSLVAQRDSFDESVAAQLLNDFEVSLKQVLEDSDTVVQCGFADDTANLDVDVKGPTETSSVLTNGVHKFEWSLTAVKIRDEIARLAAASETDIEEDTSIFELGLDSIDAIKLSSKLKKQGIDLPVSTIMRSLTISNMVARINDNEGPEEEVPKETVFQTLVHQLEDIVHRERSFIQKIGRVLPLTPLQEAMVAEMITSDFERYFNHDVLHLAPGTDVDRIAEALTAVVKASPILRTSFLEIDDPRTTASFAQIVHTEPHDFLHLRIIDREPDFQDVFTEIQRVVTASPWEPLFRAQILRSPTKTYLVLSIAHALYDGWSLSLLHSDIQDAYYGNLQPRPSYDGALRGILETSSSNGEAFWRDFLADAKPTCFPRRSNTNARSSPEVHRLGYPSKVDLEKLSAFAKSNSVSLEALGQAVFAMVLASHTGSLDVTFGSVLSGRDDLEMSELLFPTMNTLAVRAVLHGSRQDMVQYVQENLLKIKQWQHFPLRKAKALSGAHGQLFESLFIYQRTAKQSDEPPESLYKSLVGHSDVEYPVCVEMEVVDSKFVWRCAVKEEVFDEAGAAKLLADLDEVLEEVVERPQEPAIGLTSVGTSICGLPAFVDATEAEENFLNGHVILKQEMSNSRTAKIIREVLAAVSQTPEDEITVGMTIFHMGLDSISAIKVSSLLRKQSVQLSVGEMLRAGTVERMAQIVDARVSAVKGETQDITVFLKDVLGHIDVDSLLEKADMDKSLVAHILPATAGQTYMMSMWLNSGQQLFYPEFNYQLDGDMRLDQLRDCWNMLVEGNPILRTVLLATNDDRFPYIQAIQSDTKASITDISDLEERMITETMTAISQKQPYAHLFVSSTARGWNLHLKIHHALYDGVSLPLLMDMFLGLCRGAPKHATPRADTQALAGFSAIGASQATFDKRKSFWTRYLAGVSPRHLTQPASLPSAKTEVFIAALIPQIQDFEALARRNGVSVQALTIATYAKVYAGLTSTPKDSDVALGIYLANRSLDIPNIAHAMVPTVNLVPFRVSMPLQRSVMEVAKQVQSDIEVISRAENAAVSLWEIKEWTGVTVDTWVNFLKLPEKEMHASGEEEHQSAMSTKSRSLTLTPTDEWDGEFKRRRQLVYPKNIPAPKRVVSPRVNAAYLHAVDIEATVRDGALDVGVFVPVEMLELEEAEKLVNGLKLELERIMVSGKTAHYTP